MFFITNRGRIIKEQRDELKTKALEITALERENTQLRFTQKKISNRIKDFDYIKGNPFSLINEIKDDLQN